MCITNVYCRRCEKDKVNNKTYFVFICIVECDMRVLYIATRRLISVESVTDTEQI